MSSGSENEDAGFQLMNAKSTERAKQRAEIAQTQKRLIDELVEMRVKMQTLLVLANRLPQGKLHDAFMERNDGIKTKSSSLSTAVSGVLRSTMDMDFCLGEKIPTLYKDAATGAALRQLESTMKETDGNHWFACVQEVSSHKRSWEEETASHWDKRAQVQSGKTLKLNALNTSLFEQVDSIMEDDFRWRKRSTVLRGDYQIVGEDIPVDDDGQRRNSSVYDDQEFYNSLLNQYAALAMNKNAKVIRQRVSKKKEIQRKASKGRHLIYNVHPKLQNFCAPEKYPTPDIDVQQLFSSLFGKTAN
ncbi:TRAUB family protein [Blastocystis sp. ATCC 50177/Nand II]|uniref:TRAUB family protein n=1 Tax=Blastocystis sp. subtype 1 (strain ATCC 50177 / NandII) TaxID=478820 RepID=A0A196SGW4_BLAHN|nr:TRAUB family protein [Blastocystis sp. ATCC 50177/Nand II]